MRKIYFSNLILFLFLFAQSDAIITPYNFGSSVVTFSDDFARSNESPLSKSGAWAQPAGSTVNAVNLISNNAKGSTANENIAVVLTPVFPADHRAKITYAGGVNYTRVWVRLSDSGGYAFCSDTTTRLIIFKIANSGSALTYTQLGANITPSSPLTSGDTLELEVIGTTINAYINDVLVGTRTDSTYSTGQPGLGSYDNVNIALNFSATSAPF